MSLDFRVTRESCVRCGRCAADCPAGVIDWTKGGLPAVQPHKEAACYRCQHCVAVCPTGALSILGLDPRKALPLEGGLPRPEQVETLIKGRRAVRRYRQENLPPALVEHLLEVAWHAPTGKNTRQTLFTVVDDRARLAALREEVMAGLARLVEAGRLPEGLAFYAEFLRLWREHGVDVIFRGAPHLLITSSPKGGPSPQPDGLIALACFELYAQASGVGTLWNGLAKLAVNDLLPEQRARLGIPEDHVIGYAMSFGPPAVTYARTVQHGPARVNRVS